MPKRLSVEEREGENTHPSMKEVKFPRYKELMPPSVSLDEVTVIAKENPVDDDFISRFGDLSLYDKKSDDDNGEKEVFCRECENKSIL